MKIYKLGKTYKTGKPAVNIKARDNRSDYSIIRSAIEDTRHLTGAERDNLIALLREER